MPRSPRAGRKKRDGLTPDALALARNLARRVSDSGLTHQELSERAGVAMRSIAGYLAEKNVPPADVAHRLAQVLDTTVDKLFEIPPE